MLSLLSKGQGESKCLGCQKFMTSFRSDCIKTDASDNVIHAPLLVVSRNHLFINYIKVMNSHSFQTAAYALHIWVQQNKVTLNEDFVNCSD